MKAQRRKRIEKSLAEMIETRAANYRSNWRARARKLGRDVSEVPDMTDIVEWLQTMVQPDGTVIDGYTGERVPFEKAQVDHVAPLSRDGGFSLSNCMLMSARTNRMKGRLLSDEFRRFLAFLDTLPAQAANDITDRLSMASTVWRRSGR